jgi:hypothetical protein
MGDYCRKQYNGLNETDKTDFIQKICSKQVGLEECKCWNRQSDPVYGKIDPGPYPDKCWYIPCSDGTRYFLTNENKVGNCPDNICQQVYKFTQDKHIKISNNDVNINCDFARGGVIPDLNVIPPVIYYMSILLFFLFIVVFTFKPK